MNKRSNIIRIAFIGLGWVTREIWLPIFESVTEFNLIAGFDIESEAVKKIKRKCPYLKICNNITEIISEKPDLVLIATPNKFHVEYAEIFLEKNISVMIEKPICLNLCEYERLRKSVLNSSAMFLPSSVNKHRDDIRILAEIINSNEFGPVNSIDISWIRAVGIPRPGSWFTNKNLAGGGVGYDLGWHILDVGFSLLGYPDVCNALGVGSSSSCKNERLHKAAQWRNELDNGENLPEDVEDQMVGFVKTINNIAISFKCAWVSHNEVDTTKIVISCQNASIELLTTFGFSPNRIKEPCLKVLQNGKLTRVWDFKSIVVGAEYKDYVKSILNTFGNKQMAYENINKIHPIIKTLDLIYCN